MRSLIFLAAFLAAPIAAAAQVPTGMVLLPRNIAEAAGDWKLLADPKVSLHILEAIQDCIASNAEVAPKPDACPVVTKALAEMRKPSHVPAPAHTMPAPTTEHAP